MTIPTDPLAKFLGEMEKMRESHFDFDEAGVTKLIRICRIQNEALERMSHEYVITLEGPAGKRNYYAAEAIESVNQIAGEG